MNNKVIAQAIVMTVQIINNQHHPKRTMGLLRKIHINTLILSGMLPNLWCDMPLWTHPYANKHKQEN
eukprot:7282136-Ditylum_brightwellii.AAC.1